MPAIIRLPHRLQASLETTSSALFNPRDARQVDFTQPAGEAALADCDSVSWRIFKNPIALLIGGLAAVILELAEPAVRTGVWTQSTFLKDPLGRLQRTGLAAMVTVYAGRSVAEPMIAGVVRMHHRVRGRTPDGVPYAADDEDLLNWVHATAVFGFGAAYDRYVAPLPSSDLDRLFAEGRPAALLYGARGTPCSVAGWHAQLHAMRGRLEPSDIVQAFLSIMRTTSAFPAALRWLQPIAVRAAVDLVPPWVRQRLGLAEDAGLRPHERWLIKLAGALADRVVLARSPPALSCERLGLPATFLYAR